MSDTPAGGGDAIQQPCIFSVQAPAGDLSGIEKMLELTRATNAAMAALMRNFKGIRMVTIPELDPTALEAAIKKLDVKGAVRNLDAGVIAEKLLGPDLARAFQQKLPALQKTFGDSFSGNKFANSKVAGEMLADFNNQARKAEIELSRGFQNIFKGGGLVSTQIPIVSQPAASPGLGVGQGQLVVPPDRLTVVLGPGNLTLTIPADRLTGTLPAPAAATAATVPPTPTSPASTTAPAVPPAPTPPAAPRKAKAPTSPVDAEGFVIAPNIEDAANELKRRVVETEASSKTIITKHIDAFKKLTQVFTDESPTEPTVRIEDTSKVVALRNRLSEQAANIGSNASQFLAQDLTGDRSADLRTRAAVTGGAAKALNDLLVVERAGAEALGQETLLARLGAQVEAMKLQARRDTLRADRADLAAKEKATKEFLSAVGMGVKNKQTLEREATKAAQGVATDATRTRRGRSAIEQAAIDSAERGEERAKALLRENQADSAAQISVAQARQRIAELQAPASGFTQQQRVENKGFRRGRGFEGVETVTFQRDVGNQRNTETVRIATAGNKELAASLSSVTRALKATREEAGASGREFFRNLGTVTAWQLSVGALYGTLGLVTRGFQSFIDTSYQTARLGVVFSKVGGSAQELTNDVLRLAAAEGRSSKEALDSAISWSRLGLTRSQVNQAVLTSMRAANVAEVDAAEATDHLQAVYQSYGLSVSQLSGVLAQLNEISNQTNAGVGEMFNGLSKVASVASQAGIPLSTLNGLLGGIIAKTKQSGATVGTALKTIIGRLSSPDLLQTLHSNFQIPVVDSMGSQKGVLDLLDAVYAKHVELTGAERTELSVRLAGNTQLNRAMALLDGYIANQALAIKAQLELNSANREDAVIRETLKNRMQGLSTELTRFAAIQGGNGPGQAVGLLANSFKNLAAVLNLPGVSVATTGVFGWLTAVAARAVLTKSKLDAAGATPGFVGRSLTRVRGFMPAIAEGSADMALDVFSPWRWKRRGWLAGNALRDGFKTSMQGASDFAAAKTYQGAAAAIVTSVGGLGSAGGGVFRALSALLGKTTVLLLAAAAAMKVFNTVADKFGLSGAAGDERLEKYNETINRFANEADAATKAGRLLEVVIRSLATASPEGILNGVEGLKQLPENLQPNVATLERLTTNPKDAQVILQPILDDIKQQAAAAALRKALVSRMKLKHLELEVESLERSPIADTSVLNQRKRERDQARSETIQQTISKLNGTGPDAEDPVDQQLRTDKQKRITDQLDHRKNLLHSILTVGVGESAVAQLEVQRIALDAYIAALDDAEASVNRVGKSGFEARALIEKEIEGLEKQTVALVEESHSEGASKRQPIPLDGSINDNSVNTRMALASGLGGLGAGMWRAEEFQPHVITPFERFIEFFQDLMAGEKARPTVTALADTLKGAAMVPYPGDPFTQAGIGGTPADKDMERLLTELGRERSGKFSNLQSAIAKKTLESKGAVPEAVTDNLQAIRDARTKARIEREALEDKWREEMARRQDQVTEGTKKAGRELIPYDYGDNETEKLQRQLRAAQAQLVEATEQSTAGDDLNAKLRAAGESRALALEITRLQEAQSRRQMEIERDINQLIIDRGREFQKMILTASTPDLIRTLAALKMTEGGTKQLSAGQFFGAGDLREKILSIPGLGFDEARLRRERAQAGQAPAPVDTNPTMGAATKYLSGLLRTGMPAGLNMQNPHEKSVSEMAAAANGAKSALQGLQAEVKALSGHLGVLGQKVQGLFKGGAQSLPVNPQTMGLLGGK